jgi:hypothetical protein
MRALEASLPAEPPAWLNGLPLLPLALLGATAVAAALTLPRPAVRLVGLAAIHGSLLGAALAWTARDERRERWAPVQAAALLGVVATCASLFSWGALAYVAVPLWLAYRRPAWLAPSRRDALAIAGGATFGLLLGGHLVVCSWLTFGYRLYSGSLATLAGWWAYDLGANVLAAEAFFRGALFEHTYRRWSFPAAAAVATGASVLRYLADPLLPHSLGIMAGAAFYTALLGAGSCWLLARTGTLLPGAVAGVCFFAAYRMLALG